MTDSQRNIIFITILFIFLLIWQSFELNNIKKNKINESKLYNLSNNFKKKINKINNFIKVKTDVLSVLIDMNGGNIRDVFLLNYKDKIESLKPIHLLKCNKNFVYKANSEIKDISNKKINNKSKLYHSEKKNYVLNKKKNNLLVPIKYISPDGIIYKKVFLFKKNDFAIQVNHYINNKSKNSINVKFFGKLIQSYNLPIKNNKKLNKFSLHTYRGAAYSTDLNKYQKYSFDNIKNNNLKIKTNNGWIAMLQQYFATAWIPLNSGTNTFYSKYYNKNYVSIGFRSSTIIIPPKSSYKFISKLWVGPEIQEKMKETAPYLDLTVDYGWLWFISQPIFKLLKFINYYVNNWGLSIILITLIIRIIMYPLTKSQYISMAKIKILHPKLLFIREKFKNDKQKQSQEIIMLYKKEKVNPLGGCFPLIIQMPIFLSLYYVLSSSIELRHSPFYLWIYDLSDKDPLYILPIFMGLTMFFIQKISPSTSSDQSQKKIMMFTPIIFIFFFLWFPSGLVLYYIVSNLITIIQQYIIYKNLDKKGLNFWKK
ncbi:membrane protein insertase YidC [Sodalis-like secondary symbiont of Drepanosiphum platanoidis]|uniref:membrane protein insertase YidC n=1 Tax=Sodalis-like secondary symbiont of Drepanosiphum platanoidis TaxID=2994493 RepID=UPI0034646840